MGFFVVSRETKESYKPPVVNPLVSRETTKAGGVFFGTASLKTHWHN